DVLHPFVMVNVQLPTLDRLLQEIERLLLRPVLERDPPLRDGRDALVDGVHPLVVRVVLADGVGVGRSLLQHEDAVRGDSSLPRLHGRGNPCRTGTDDEQIEHHGAMLTLGGPLRNLTRRAGAFRTYSGAQGTPSISLPTSRDGRGCPAGSPLRRL